MNWFLAHLVGDYLIQNDWMAQKKKVGHFACAIHAGTYLIPFLFLGLAWWQLALIGVEHFAQDRWGFVPWFMKVTGHSAFAGPPLGPWSIILTDNIIHLLWIAGIIWVGAR